LPSEDKGHTFESCRVRHFSTTPEQNWVLRSAFDLNGISKYLLLARHTHPGHGARWPQSEGVRCNHREIGACHRLSLRLLHRATRHLAGVSRRRPLTSENKAGHFNEESEPCRCPGCTAARSSRIVVENIISILRQAGWPPDNIPFSHAAIPSFSQPAKLSDWYFLSWRQYSWYCCLLSGKGIRPRFNCDSIISR
jgi:hypothetical protein